MTQVSKKEALNFIEELIKNLSSESLMNSINVLEYCKSIKKYLQDRQNLEGGSDIYKKWGFCADGLIGFKGQKLIGCKKVIGGFERDLKEIKAWIAEGK